MPERRWKHTCHERGTHYWVTTPDACSCGGPFVYDGWHNGRLEAMAWYQKHYGLKPIGPHIALHERLMGDAYAKCDECSGTGYHDVDNGRSYRICPTCEGSGSILTISVEELMARRDAVLAEYPDAAAPFDIPNPSTGNVIHDIGAGRMIVLPPEETE